MLIGYSWGFGFAVFLYPVNIGVTMTCIFLLVFTAIGAAATSHIPLTLGSLSSLMTSESMREAAKAAAEKSIERKTPLNLEMGEWCVYT